MYLCCSTVPEAVPNPDPNAAPVGEVPADADVVSGLAGTGSVMVGDLC